MTWLLGLAIAGLAIGLMVVWRAGKVREIATGAMRTASLAIAALLLLPLDSDQADNWKSGEESPTRRTRIHHMHAPLSDPFLQLVRSGTVRPVVLLEDLTAAPVPADPDARTEEIALWEATLTALGHAATPYRDPALYAAIQARVAELRQATERST